jgi:uncharacterized membrane protein
MHSDEHRLFGDRGSTTPLILVFFLIALVFTGGAIATSDAFTAQRRLQSVCDGAAIAAANVASEDALHGGGASGRRAIPLGDAAAAVEKYLARDPARAGVRALASLRTDGTTIDLVCTTRSDVAFQRMFGRSDGVTQTAHSAARSPLLP